LKNQCFRAKNAHGAYGTRTLELPSTLHFVFACFWGRRLVPAPDVDFSHETKEYFEPFTVCSSFIASFMNKDVVDKLVGYLGRHCCYIGMFFDKIRKLADCII
jgi:hypothetical protein